MHEITVPHNYTPRNYQKSLYNCLHKGIKRGVAVWHRRAGKDKTLLNIVAKEMWKRVGAYYYFFPTYQQGRKIIWDGMDRDGYKFMHHIPEEIRASTHKQEMKIITKNGSLFQIVGSDNIDSIVGTNPIGCVFSEFALQDPTGWEFVRPILRENGGFALFNYTPRGHNHGYQLSEMARNNPEWFHEILTIKDTGVLSEVDINRDRAEGMKEDLIDQEYYCSFDAAIPGAYYAREIRDARNDRRITDVGYDPEVPVDTYWDLGIGDSTSIWFAQNVFKEIRLIDYYETSGEGLSHYAKVLEDKAYRYGRHIAPHDIKVRELGTGKSRIETAKSLGIEFDIAPQMSVDDGIEAVRQIFRQCWFDQTLCSHGINALASYHKAHDEKNMVFKLRPVHDWSSHAADAFRIMAVENGMTGYLLSEYDRSRHSYRKEGIR